MRFYAFCICGLLASLNLFALDLNWASAAGGSSTDRTYAIAIDDQGNVFSTGYFRDTALFSDGTLTFSALSNGGNDVFVQKQNPNGNILWVKHFGGGQSDFGWGITTDKQGNVIICGQFMQTVDFDPGSATVNHTAIGDQDIYVLKLNGAGDFQWVQVYGGTSTDIAFDIEADGDDNLLVTGNFFNEIDFDNGAGQMIVTSAGLNDVFVLKLDAQGQSIFAEHFGGIARDYANELALDANGGIHITGYFQLEADFDPGVGVANRSTVGDYDSYTVKLDSTGTFKWVSTIGSTAFDEGEGIAVDRQGNVYTCGVFQRTADFDPSIAVQSLSTNGQVDGFIQKLDQFGNLVWARNFGGSSNDRCLSITVDDNQQVYSTGYFRDSIDLDPGVGQYLRTSAGSDDLFIQVLDSQGLFQSGFVFGGTESDKAFTIRTKMVRYTGVALLLRVLILTRIALR